MAIFRRAVPSDFSGIMEVVSQAQRFMAGLGIDQWQDGYPSSELIAADIEADRAYVMVEDGNVASITVLTAEPEPIYDAIDGAWHTGSPYLTIHRMAIGDANRHSGLAAQILENAISMARAGQLSGVRADTHRGNAAMRRFLEKSGFRECGLVVYETAAGDPIRVAYDLPLC